MTNLRHSVLGVIAVLIPGLFAADLLASNLDKDATTFGPSMFIPDSGLFDLSTGLDYGGVAAIFSVADGPDAISATLTFEDTLVASGGAWFLSEQDSVFSADSIAAGSHLPWGDNFGGGLGGTIDVEFGEFFLGIQILDIDTQESLFGWAQLSIDQDFKIELIDQALELDCKRIIIGRDFAFHGDADGDGSVDVGDFNTWNENQFTTTTDGPSAGDFNNDGFVDVTDFNLWNENKFTGCNCDAAPVPEMDSLSLLIGGAVCFALGRIRQFDRRIS